MTTMTRACASCGKAIPETKWDEAVKKKGVLKCSCGATTSPGTPEFSITPPSTERDPCLSYHGGADTSVEAFATTSASKRAMDRQKIIDYMKKQPHAESTCDEAEVALDMAHQTCSARFTDLQKEERIVNTGKRRPTRTGKQARVYRVST